MSWKKDFPSYKSRVKSEAYSFLGGFLGIMGYGRNIIRNSDFRFGESRWVRVRGVKEENGIKYISQGYGWDTRFRYPMSEGIYTASVLVRRQPGDENARFRHSISYRYSNGDPLEESNSNIYVDLTEDGWHRVSYQITIPADIAYINGYYLNGTSNNSENEIDMTEFKIEEGSIETEWRPAPEDMLQEFMNKTKI